MENGAAGGSLVATAYSPGYSTLPRPVIDGGPGGRSTGTVITTGQHTLGHGLPNSHWSALRRSSSAHSVLGDEDQASSSSTRYVHTIQVTDSPAPASLSPASLSPAPLSPASIEDNWGLKGGPVRRYHSYDGVLEDNLTDWASSEDLAGAEDMAHRPPNQRISGPQQFRYVIRSPHNQQIRGYPSPYRQPGPGGHRHHSPPVRFQGQPVGQAIYVHGPRSPRSPGPMIIRGPPPGVHVQGGQVSRQGQVVYRHPGGYSTAPRQVVYIQSPRAANPPASAQRLYVKHSAVHLGRSASKASHVSHASSSGLVARAQGGARTSYPTMPRLARSNSTGDLLDDSVNATYQTLPKNFRTQREPVSPVSPGYALSIQRAPDVPPFHPPPLVHPAQDPPRAIQTKPEVRPDGVVYHGHYVTVKVPRYVVNVDDEASKLRLTKLRYHSEPNLLDIDNDNLDDNFLLNTSTPPESPLESPVDSPLESPLESPQESPMESPLESPLESPVTHNSDVTPGQDPPRDNSPKTVVLQRGGNGFGFVLRGAKAQTSAGSSLDFTPTSDFPALQYLDRVDKHSPADRAGLKPGDFLLEINGEVVVNATHEHTVNLIKYSGDTLAMKVITVKPLSSEGLERDIHADGTRTLPIKKKAAPAPPRRDPHTSLTASRATGRSIRESLAELEKLDVNLAQFDEVDYDSAAVRRGVDVNNKTASIRARQAHARLTAYEIEDMMTRQGMTQVDVHHSASSQNKPMIPVLPKTYNSVADMKKKNGNGTLSKNHRARSTPNLAQDEEMQIYQNSDLASRRHVANIDLDQGQPVYSRQISTPDTSTLGRRVANGSPAMQREQMYAVPNTPQRHYRSVENVLEATVPAGGKYIIPPHPHEPAPTPPRPRSGIPPPPDHPPPIPPHDRTQTEVVKITKSPTYANVSAQIQQQKRSESDYESSFRPGIGARLNKEPIVPESVGLRKLAHSRSSSNVSSGSDHSGDQKPLNVRGTVEIFEQNSGQTTPSRKESVSFAEDKVVENAAKFVKEHPGANVLYTADQKRHNGGHIYEPEPDYDDTDQTLSHIPEVRSLRETWQTSGQKNRHVPVTPPSSRSVHNVTQSSYISESQPKNQRSSFAAQPRKPTTQTPRTPDQEDSSNMSAFSSAIKQAAIAREQKKNSPTAQPPPPPPAQVNRQNVSQTSRSQAAPNAPPPPPPPPPPSTTEPRVSPQTVRNGTPPQVRPQMEEKRRNDPHAALMAAIAKRRGMVDKVNGDTLADSIEDKIQKNKKPVSNGNKPSSTTIDLKPSPKSQAPIPPNDLPKPNPAPVTPTSNTSSPSPSDEPQNFRAMAERRRQEYLQKKAAGTLDRRKGSPSPHSRSSPKSPDDEEKENEPQKAKPLNQCSPSPAVSQQTNNSNNSGNGTGLGDIASVIAQRAMQRQKSTSGIVDSNGNKANEKASHSTVYKSPVANNNGGSRQRGDGDKGMEVKGATVDFSHTESPRDERLSVFARAKMFESSKNQSKSSVTNGASLPFDLPPPVIETNGTYLVDDIPPPMITPPPPEFDYSHSPDLDIVSNGHTQNGLETVGWVINSSPPRYSQEYAIRNKTATMNSYSVSPSHRETLVDDIQVDFIPPPPLFDGDLGPEPPLHTGNKVVAEDAASMVSSLSTLSTVSSSEHESYQHDSSGYSSSRNRFTPLHTSSAQSEEVFLEVAPPPPGFDDGGEDFIPPPMGFGIPGPDDRQPVNNLRHNLRNTGRASQGYHSKAVEEWTTQDICDWLDSINLGHLAIHFIRAGLQGDQLTHMGSQDYLMLGITSPDHRMSVERAVRRVQLNR